MGSRQQQSVRLRRLVTGWLGVAGLLLFAGGCATVKPAFDKSDPGSIAALQRLEPVQTELDSFSKSRRPSPALPPTATTPRAHVEAAAFSAAPHNDLLVSELEAEKAWYKRGGAGTLWTDQGNFYTRSDYRFAAMSLGLAASFAHTDVDEQFRKWWQDDVRSNAWDDFSHFTKPFGDGYISVAIMGAGAVLGNLASETRIGNLSGEWGRRSLRGIAVGAPALLFLQAATGAGRPGEWSSESDWVPFKDTNGASGHAFMGAVPFLVAAQMTENRFLSGLWYTGSAMCGVSRINDDAHYLSQVILGWSLAQLACQAVEMTEADRGEMEVVPLVGHGGTVGIGVQFRR